MGKVHFKISIDNYPGQYEAACGIEDYFTSKKYTGQPKKVTCQKCKAKMKKEKSK
jgi:hypothetical protein